MTRTYTYGLLPPTHNAALVAEQVWLGHDYRNRLVEVEQVRRAAVREILDRCVDPADQERLAELVRLHEEARQDILRTRARSRRRADTAEQRARARDLGRQVQQLRSELARQRREPTESARVGLAWATAASYQGVRDARGAFSSAGLYWGTYLLHERAMRASAASASSPEFVPWRGEGRVAVQIQLGIDVAELAEDTRVQVQPGRPIPAGGSAWSGLPLHGSGPRGGLGARRSRVLRLRVGSCGRSPVWAEWPMQLHRPLPEGARVKMATVQICRRGTRWDWSVQFAVDDDACARPPAPEGGAVALNLGYARRDGGGARAGYLVGSDGREGEVCLPARVASALGKADAIRSQRDRDLDAARAALVAWAGSLDPESVPAWFRERTEHLHAWRSPGRLAALARDWQVGWWEGGAAGYDVAERWRVRDLHLERYETGLRSSALRSRRDGYRVLARQLAGRYRTLVVDDTDLRRLQELPEAESEDSPAWQAVRRRRVAVAPHELRACLVDAFGADRTVKLSAVDVTRVHAATLDAGGNLVPPCGYRNQPQPESREVTCAGCGAVYDQDASACRNLLAGLLRAEATGEGRVAPRKRRGHRMRKSRIPSATPDEEVAP